MSVSNPAPVIASYTVIPLVGGLAFEYVRPDDLDFEGVRIYGATSSGFTVNDTTLLADSKESSVVIQNLIEGETYYFKYIPYDAFGDGSTSGEDSATTRNSAIMGEVEDSGERQVGEDEYIVYADVATVPDGAKWLVSGTASLTVTNPESGWSESAYQSCKIAAFLYNTKTLIPYSVDLSSSGYFRPWGVGHRVDGDGENIAQYVSVGDYLTFKADNGVESKLYEVKEIDDDTTLYVEYVDANVSTTAYTVRGDANSTQCRVYSSPSQIYSSVFSKVKWSKQYVANSGEDFDLTGGWQFEMDDVDATETPNILMMLWAPSMGCAPGVSTQALDEPSIKYQFTYKGA